MINFLPIFSAARARAERRGATCKAHARGRDSPPPALRSADWTLPLQGHRHPGSENYYCHQAGPVGIRRLQSPSQIRCRVQKAKMAPNSKGAIRVPYDIGRKRVRNFCSFPGEFFRSSTRFCWFLILAYKNLQVLNIFELTPVLCFLYFVESSSCKKKPKFTRPN